GRGGDLHLLGVGRPGSLSPPSFRNRSRMTLMRIADVRAFELKPYPEKLKFFDKMPAHAFERVLVRVIADNGLEGRCITYLMSPAEMRQRLPGIRQLLKGRDPHDTELVSYALTAGLERPSHVASAIDICLWD